MTEAKNLTPALQIQRSIASSDEKRSVAEMRAKILQLEAAMLAMPEHQIEIKTTHYFAPGLYMREIFIPKGTLLTGKIQKTEYLNIVSQGDISVMTEDGMKRTKGPGVLRSMPGLKRAGYAHEDSVWLTVHQNPTNARDIETLEAMLFAESFDEVPASMPSSTEEPVITWQGKPKRSFGDVLKLLGATPEEVTAVSENLADQMPFPVEPMGIVIADSPIHGKGVFATLPFPGGTVLAPARIDGKRTPAGRYCNHGADPNAAMIKRDNGDVDLVATKPIAPGEEVLSDYYLNFANTRGGI